MNRPSRTLKSFECIIAMILGAASLTAPMAGQCSHQWLPIGQGINGTVYAAEMFDDGSGAALYVGGGFSLGRQHVAKWTGSSWEPVGTQMTNTVRSLASHDDGTGPALYAGIDLGAFNFIARWNGRAWSPVGTGFNNSVHTFLSNPFGNPNELIAAGDFEFSGAGSQPVVAAWNGTTWMPIGPAQFGGIRSLEVFPQGNTLSVFAGWGQSSGGVDKIRMLTPSGWQPVGGGINQPNSFVLSLHVWNDGASPALHAGGHFTQAGFNACNNIAKWDGTAWVPLGIGVNGSYPEVIALASFVEDGQERLFAGGSFDSAGMVGAANIARWDGSSWSSVAGGLNSGVDVLKSIQFNGRDALLAGGEFTMAGGLPVNHVAIWTAVGNAPPFISQPQSLDVIQGNPISLNVVATGATTFQWRKDGTALVDSEHVSGSTTAFLNVMNAQRDDEGIYDVIVGNACGESASDPAPVNVRPPCPADIDGSGAVNVTDLLLVINLWGPCAGQFCQIADIVPPTGNGIVNVDDLLGVINMWGTCPQ